MSRTNPGHDAGTFLSEATIHVVAILNPKTGKPCAFLSRSHVCTACRPSRGRWMDFNMTTDVANAQVFGDAERAARDDTAKPNHLGHAQNSQADWKTLADRWGLDTWEDAREACNVPVVLTLKVPAFIVASMKVAS